VLGFNIHGSWAGVIMISAVQRARNITRKVKICLTLWLHGSLRVYSKKALGSSFSNTFPDLDNLGCGTLERGLGSMSLLQHLHLLQSHLNFLFNILEGYVAPRTRSANQRSSLLFRSKSCVDGDGLPGRSSHLVVEVRHLRSKKLRYIVKSSGKSHKCL
jgi:hypothetical protein